MNSSKKKIAYIFWTLLAVAIGLGIAAGVTRTAQYAYAKLGSPGKELFASADRAPIHIGLPKIGKGTKFLTDSVTYKRAETQDAAVAKSPASNNVNFGQQADEDTIRIGWVGDITPVDTSKMPGTFAPFSEVSSLLVLPDITAGNLEGVITQSDTSKCSEGEANCFAFRGDLNFVELLKNSGFDVMNMANNHAFDFGKESFSDTANALLAKQITPTGAPSQVSIVETKGVKVAFVGFAPNAGTNPMLDIENVKRTIADAKTKADIVVAFIHAGAEGTQYLHVTDSEEVYLGENRGNTMQIAHAMVDAGADLVLGSGPHVLRGMEKYKGKVIVYSMGNFFASTNLSTRGLLSLSGIFMIDLAKDGTPKAATLVPLYLDTNGIPHIDGVETSISLVNKLSTEDFGGNSIMFDDAGVTQIN